MPEICTVKDRWRCIVGKADLGGTSARGGRPQLLVCHLHVRICVSSPSQRTRFPPEGGHDALGAGSNTGPSPPRTLTPVRIRARRRGTRERRANVPAGHPERGRSLGPKQTARRGGGRARWDARGSRVGSKAGGFEDLLSQSRIDERHRG
ncbi:hypothetical protein AAFF_G00012850 [Aldrovandia affinis]|uniref:Uncharacterized protein n=1 Tax=Aldrovandia affinis TaxID=143900 RepID=A0AAD7S6K1_9TELE|nr:hypothetical protein AAFF_G00012850 [Aldrovandia affinis]